MNTTPLSQASAEFVSPNVLLRLFQFLRCWLPGSSVPHDPPAIERHHRAEAVLHIDPRFPSTPSLRRQPCGRPGCSCRSNACQLLATAALLLSLFSASSGLAAEPAAEKETFKTLRIAGQIRTNVYVSSVTPIGLTVFYDGGLTQLHRKNLPPELAALYPYNPEEAAEFERSQAEKISADRERHRGEAYKSLLRREGEIQRQINVANDSLVVLQRQINLWKPQPRGRGKIVALQQLHDQKASAYNHISSLQNQLEQVRNLQAQYR